MKRGEDGGNINLLRRLFLLAFSLTEDRPLPRGRERRHNPARVPDMLPRRQTDAKRSGWRPAVNRDGLRVR